MTLQWFLSKTVRQAASMRKHVRRLLNAQRDILSPQAVLAVNDSLAQLGAAIRENPKKEALLKQMEKLEEVANKWLKPYPHAAWRENIEVLLVALAVAMGIRTFFVQPFKIPTGSMQPTLFGVTSENLINQPDFKIPTGVERIKQWIQGVSYVHVVAERDGTLDEVEQPLKLLIINLRQRLKIDGKWQTIWFPPDCGSPPYGTLEFRAGLQIGQHFKAGEDVVKLKVIAGDYLFVNRTTYNFRQPQRGEIIVFETRGIDQEARDLWRVPGDQFYIKRMVALGGEHVQIGEDRHLVINGRRLDASTEHFENVYGGLDGYLGHLPVQRFADGRTYDLRPKHLMVMGDNTANSLDSRYFGDFDEHYVIGKSSFVYWPISSRFGFGYR